MRPELYQEDVPESLLRDAKTYKGLLEHEAMSEEERFVMTHFIGLLEQGRRRVMWITLFTHSAQMAVSRQDLFHKTNKLMEADYIIDDVMRKLEEKGVLITKGSEHRKRIRIRETLEQCVKRIRALVSTEQNHDEQLDLVFTG